MGRISPRCLSVSSKMIRSPSGSTTALTVVVRPPRLRPMACSSAPLFHPPLQGCVFKVVLSVSMMSGEACLTSRAAIVCHSLSSSP